MLDQATEQKLLNLISALERFSQQTRLASRLNIFEAAGLARQEIRHSNFLAFLLDPKKPHGLDDGFLKRVIQKGIENLSSKPLSSLSVALASFSDAWVRREWRDIDLLIESQSNRLIFAIENKIDSSESENQLKKYREIIQFEYPNHQHLFCYLTPDGDPPSEDSWATLSYSDIADALQQAKTQPGSSLNDEAAIVINHYLDLVRSNIVPDQELIELCRKLYAQHKAALDLVILHGEVNDFNSAAELFFKKHPEVTPIQIRSGAASFLPNALFQILPEMADVNWRGQSRPFLFWFNRYNDKLGIVLEVGPFAGENSEREALVREMQKHFANNNRIYPKFTRVYSKYHTVTEEDAGDFEKMHASMEELYKHVANKHLPAVTNILSHFFQK